MATTATAKLPMHKTVCGWYRRFGGDVIYFTNVYDIQSDTFFTNNGHYLDSNSVSFMYLFCVNVQQI